MKKGRQIFELLIEAGGFAGVSNGADPVNVGFFELFVDNFALLYILFLMILWLFLLSMPLNPFVDIRQPFVKPCFAVFVNAPCVPVEKPVSEKHVLVLLIDFSDNKCNDEEFLPEKH